MRILLWPTYSYLGNVGADSLYIIARNLIRASEPGEFQWTLVVPEQPTVPVDDLDERGDVVKHRVKVSLSYRAQEATPNPDVVWGFSPQDSDKPVDVLISMSPARTLNVANAWSIRVSEDVRPLLVNWDLLVRDDRPGEMVADPAELLQQAAGGAMADLNVHESPVARRMALDVARKHLSGSNVRSLLDRSIDVVQGIPVDRLMEVVKATPKREKFTVYYGGRFTRSKRLTDLVEVFDAFYRFGRDVEFVVTTGSLHREKEEAFRKRFPHVELHIGLSQEDAWAVMASCHASICFSTHELFGMAFWEQMAAGLDVVMQAASWNADLLPPDHPWVCKGPVEAGAMLREMHRRWETDPAPEPWTNPQATWVRENYDSQRNSRDMLDRIAAMHATRAATLDAMFERGTRAEILGLARDALADVEDEILFTDLVKRVRKASRVGRNVVGAKFRWIKSANMLDLLHAARHLGFDDGPGYTLRRRAR